MRRILYVEFKGQGLSGPGWISWVESTRTNRSFLWRGKRLHRCVGYKYNCIDIETGDRYWVSGAKQRGGDRLYGGIVDIDEDAREAYWLEVRNRSDLVHLRCYRC